MSGNTLTLLRRRFSWLGVLSPAAWIIVLLALGSSLAVLAFPDREVKGREFWTFSRNLARLYGPVIERWNAERVPKIDFSLFSSQALERRMLSGFLSRTPLPDLIEAEVSMISRAFLGPLPSVGFVDLTDRLKEEGIYQQINEASFSPWTTRGRIFGIPHDVHPVLLGYRADLVEAAGIDVSQIETWEDFVRVMKPLMADRDGNGEPDHFLLGLWPTQPELVEVLMMQAGGGLFDENGNATLNLPVNVHVLATAVSWCVGPGRIAADLSETSASGNKLRLDGYAVSFLLADWACARWKQDLPGLAGKMKLMPLPAWTPGGRRTSVRGGSMLGITRQAPDFEAVWGFAKYLYLSPELARSLYRESDTITPIISFWSDPVFDEPDPYFGGQPKGRLYIEQAPHVPRRIASPYGLIGRSRLGDALIELADYARRNKKYTAAELAPMAQQLLDKAQAAVERQMSKNLFLSEES